MLDFHDVHFSVQKTAILKGGESSLNKFLPSTFLHSPPPSISVCYQRLLTPLLSQHHFVLLEGTMLAIFFFGPVAVR